ncbi:hypothetical protein B9Z55_026124 [Caenorhabditis nigoni]|uniref:Uncharacterized protein n=1 Tax=Caenorhabditis nigoni TaxID=1611254 RepID=A0A2G5T1X1_9PELO|nr:hypothetical protein B9Z55_026124 [Caenorhabditis nigoni]
MEKAKDHLEGCPPNMEVADWIFESLNRHDRKAVIRDGLVSGSYTHWEVSLGLKSVYVQPGIGKENRDENQDVKEKMEDKKST